MSVWQKHRGQAKVDRLGVCFGPCAGPRRGECLVVFLAPARGPGVASAWVFFWSLCGAPAWRVPGCLFLASVRGPGLANAWVLLLAPVRGPGVESAWVSLLGPARANVVACGNAFFARWKMHICLWALAGDRYTELFKKALESVELTPEHIQASVSDHEGAIRKGLRGLGAPLIGCGCHCLQLCCKHALPDLKERTKKRKSAAAKLDSDSSSSDTSDESSSSSSSSSSEAEVAEKKAPMAPGGVKGPKGDPASVECKAKLKESFSRYRSIVRYFASHDDMYNEMYSAAAQAEVPCVAYQHETPTRWSSALLQIVSVIRNNAAHALLRFCSEKIKHAFPFHAGFTCRENCQNAFAFHPKMHLPSLTGLVVPMLPTCPTSSTGVSCGLLSSSVLFWSLFA